QDTGSSLADSVAGSNAVIAGTDPFTAEVIEAGAPALGLIARTGAGYDSVDVDAAARQGVGVCHTPGANCQSVAELTVGLLLACARRLVPAANDVQAGRWVQTSGRELSGATLGVIGFGAIGKAVATIATALGMRVLAHDPALDEDFAATIGAQGRTLQDLLAESDFV